MAKRGKIIEYFVANNLMGGKEKFPSPVVIETFRQLNSYWLNQIDQKETSCFNGDVDILKYRVTVEVVKEPIETYHQRLQDLWDMCDNHHHVDPLKAMAMLFGYELIGQYGNKRKDKKSW